MPDEHPTSQSAGEAAHGREPRSGEARLADHAQIERLTGELLPALVARLGVTGLGELEVREGTWRVRLRRPRGTTGRPSDRPDRSGRASARGPRGSAVSPGGGQSTSPARDDDPGRDGGSAAGVGPLLAVAPAVGIFRARSDVRAGTRVRNGETIATVDLLGVPQEVVSPADAVVAATFVEDGDAVEYGQPLLALEAVLTVTSAGSEDVPALDGPAGAQVARTGGTVA